MRPPLPPPQLDPEGLTLEKCPEAHRDAWVFTDASGQSVCVLARLAESEGMTWALSMALQGTVIEKPEE